MVGTAATQLRGEPRWRAPCALPSWPVTGRPRRSCDQIRGLMLLTSVVLAFRGEGLRESLGHAGTMILYLYSGHSKACAEAGHGRAGSSARKFVAPAGGPGRLG